MNFLLLFFSLLNNCLIDKSDISLNIVFFCVIVVLFICVLSYIFIYIFFFVEHAVPQGFFVLIIRLYLDSAPSVSYFMVTAVVFLFLNYNLLKCTRFIVHREVNVWKMICSFNGFINFGHNQCCFDKGQY